MEREMENGEIKQQAERLVQNFSSSKKPKNSTFREILPQIAAVFIIMSNNIVGGISLGYSAILIPQLLDEQNSTSDANVSESVSSSIQVTEEDISWIASSLLIVWLPASLLAGMVIDTFGRLNTIKLSAIPNVTGWILIASATNVPMLIIGRLMVGIAGVFVTSSATVYVTEISSPRIRGSLISISPCLISCGVMLSYLEGWFLNWRYVAWISLIYIALPVTFVTLCLPESPTWLVSKNKIQQAKKSLEWFLRYSKQDNNESATEMQLSALLEDHRIKQRHCNRNENNIRKDLKMFAHPTVYKPLLILAVLYFFQQFSGLFIMLFYAVSFFKGVGTDISAYLAAVLVGVVKFSMSIVAVFLMKRYRRRSLIMLSTLGISITIGISGLCTAYITEGTEAISWIPVAMILLYIASSMMGLLNIPWTIVSELFPVEVRGITTSLCLGYGHSLMCISIQLYFTLTRLFGGLAGLQYFFSAVSLLGFVYCYVFLPETHNKKLSEMQKYFEHHWMYISLK